MENIELIIYVSIFPVFFVVMWIVAGKMLHRKSGMNKKNDIEMGDFMRKSSWGSGYINGVSFRGCLKVVEYQNGWCFRGMWLFGGVKLWIPKDNITIGELCTKKYLFM